MISVKICGITNESDLAQAVEAGADMVGFVVVETSPRYVDFNKAQTLIRKAAELGVEPWVVATIAVPWLDKLVDETPEIGAVQLHGKETPRADRNSPRCLVGCKPPRRCGDTRCVG